MHERLLAEPPEVDVLVHEALALPVHEDALQDRLRRRHRQRDRAHPEVQRRAARRHPHADAAAVVALGADAELAAREERRVEPQHALVVDEAAGREDDAAARADRGLLAAARNDRALDPPAVAAHQREAARIAAHPRARRRERAEQLLHQEAARLSRDLRHVPARRRHGHARVGPRLLAARVHEPVVGRRLAAVVRIEDGLERHALVDEPVVVVDAAAAVSLDLLGVRPRAAARHQILEHLLGGVLEAALLLERCPAAEVEHAARHRGRAAAGGGALERDDVGARGRRRERRSGAGGAEADHEHLTLFGVARGRTRRDDLRLHRAHRSARNAKPEPARTMWPAHGAA